jgi:serine/threonine protein kinase
MQKMRHKEKADLTVIHPDADPLALDLLGKMLAFDPLKRITVDEALLHPYLKGCHDSEDEITCPEKFVYPFDDSSDNDIKLHLWNEVKNYEKEEDNDAIVPNEATEQEEHHHEHDMLEYVLFNELMSGSTTEQVQSQSYFNNLLIKTANKALNLLQEDQDAIRLSEAISEFTSTIECDQEATHNIQTNLECLIRELARKHHLDLEDQE